MAPITIRTVLKIPVTLASTTTYFDKCMLRSE